MIPYKPHYQKLTSLCDKLLSQYDKIIISSGDGQNYPFDDQAIPFKCNPYFSYFFPFLSDSDHLICLEKNARPTLFINKMEDIWHKYQNYVPDPELGDFWNMDYYKDREKLIKHFLKSSSQKVALIAHKPIEGFEWNPKALLNMIDRSRFTKTSFEIECIRLANEKAVKGHIEAKKAWSEGCSEFEIHMRYCQAVSLSGGELPYENIIAVNSNASYLHYHGKERERVKDRRSFLIDAGATHLNYHSDISRTYSHNDINFKNILFHLEKLQLYLVDQVKPGVNFVDIHDLAHQKIAEVLNHTKVIDMNANDIYKNKLTHFFFPHGLGHSLGLNVHDVYGKDPNIETPQYPFLRTNRTLEENCVVTIEPGIYFIKSLLDDLKKSNYRSFINWKLVDSLRDAGGIRIEDDVLVTNSTSLNLTRKAFEKES